jgi:lysophospholipase L1-like esterase
MLHLPSMRRVECLLITLPVILWLGATATAVGQIQLTNYDATHPLRVMAIGDSITDDCSFNGAWRQFLQPLLKSNGYAFTFVGRQSSSSSGSFTETRHEGYCGSVIAAPGMMTIPVHNYTGTDVYLQKIVADALNKITPDLVLIVMGANDIGRARDPFQVATNDLPHLLDLILSNAPNANIIVTKTTTLRDAALGYATNFSNVPIYNAALQAMVQQRADAGEKISVADMFSSVDYSTMFNSDHLHPNLTGLKAMAQEFLTRIRLITQGSQSAWVTLLPPGSVWRYSDVGQDPGTNWARPDFDDSSWSSANARLGYGDKVAATTVQFGPDSSHKNPTAYFRSSFVLPDAVVLTNLDFRMAVQDGAVVWLNGQEAFRTNLPSGPISYTNLALKRMVVESGYIFSRHEVAPSLLRPGTNVLAVEVHLNTQAMPSMGFDLELLASGSYPKGPPLSIALSGTSVSLSWPANFGPYTIYSSHDPTDPASWLPYAAPSVTNGIQCIATVPAGLTPQFFRLRQK